MRIAMLGWEFPPFISGGLGTACFGLTKALDAAGHQVMFVLPRAVDRSKASHIKLLSPSGPMAQAMGIATGGGSSGGGTAAGLNPSGFVDTLPPELAALAAHADPTGALADSLAAELQSGLPHAAPMERLFTRARLMGVAANFSSPYGGGVVGTSGTARKQRRIIGTLPDGTPLYGELGLDDAADGEDVGTGEFAHEHDYEHHPAGPLGHDAHGPHIFGRGGAGAHYQGDLFAEAERYARLVVTLCKREQFDVIHAHDWLTFPAGIALARATGKPLLVHIHSTEFDRSGDNINQRVYDVERRGMMAAVRVLAVSELTRSICARRYGIPTSKLDVIYNGIENDALQPQETRLARGNDKIVLFLGRITMQKGPEYFIEAAVKVLEKVPEAKFIIAGTGDMEARMIELAAERHIGHRVLFAGFLRGRDVDRVYRMADCYVMPSVSEPFGIAPLEAMRHDVPTIISKQAGVGEVLTHVLKVDFWDTHELANKIVAVLRHPPLSQTLREHGSVEIKRLTWANSAEAAVESYRRAVQDHIVPATAFGEPAISVMPGGGAASSASPRPPGKL